MNIHEELQLLRDVEQLKKENHELKIKVATLEKMCESLNNEADMYADQLMGEDL